jgi:predicted nuclease of predicted toxin-antitoxin system
VVKALGAMRFHLDEHVADAIAKGLRQRGIDVTTTAEANLLDAEDTEHIAFALSQGRVIVTQDADFLRFHSEAMTHAGIAYFQQGSRTVGEVVSHLTLMHDCLEDSEMQGRVEYL